MNIERRSLIRAGLALVAAILGLACGQSLSTTSAQAVYGAQLDECVNSSATRAAYETCKAKTQADFAPLMGDAGAADAAKDGAK